MTRNNNQIRMVCGAILLTVVFAILVLPANVPTAPASIMGDGQQNYTSIVVVEDEIVSPPTVSASTVYDEMYLNSPTQNQYEDVHYNETTYENVCEFLILIPSDPSYHSCALYSRHIAFEAQKKGLRVGTCIICSSRTDGVMSGHQINFFEDDGKNYYNLNKDVNDFREVYTYAELVYEIKEWRGMNLTNIAIEDRWYPQ